MTSPRAAALQFDVSGLGVVVEGLTPPLAARLAEAWAPFAAPADASFLHVVAEAAAPAEDPAPFTGKGMLATFEGALARYRMREGEAEVPAAGVVRVRLEATTETKQHYALLNLVLAAFAWRLPARGGAVLHAAGIVLDERAFLLVGAEGAGKTTWARIARDRGLRVLGDDVVLVDGAAGAIEAIASPFRAEECGALAPGRWPLAAILGSVHADAAALEADTPLRAHARLHANVPFAIDGLDHNPALRETLDRLAATSRPLRLLWRPDPSFLDPLRGL